MLGVGGGMGEGLSLLGVAGKPFPARKGTEDNTVSVEGVNRQG